MASTYSTYHYIIDAKWNGSNGDVIDIPRNNIVNAIIDYDYDNRIMPIIFLDCNISTVLLDRMIKERNESTIILNIQKYVSTGNDDDVNRAVKQDYIKEEFIYFLNDDVNYKKDVNYEKKNDDNKYPEQLYVKTMIGLLNLKSINNNKKVTNAIYRNVTKTDIILLNTSHMPLLLEPISNDKTYNEFIMPPVTDIYKLLKYIDDKHTLYDTPFRYFIDFDRTYLLSSSGVNTQAIDENITSVLINIDNPAERESKIQGMKIENNIYILELDAAFTKYFIDIGTDNIYNNIICVDSNGNMVEENINLLKAKGSETKTNIVRVENIESAKLLKKKLELSSITLQIVKNNIDSSVFTINKEYNVNNFKDHIEHNGKYLLSRKQDIFSREHEHFILNNRIILRKIIT